MGIDPVTYKPVVPDAGIGVKCLFISERGDGLPLARAAAYEPGEVMHFVPSKKLRPLHDGLLTRRARSCDVIATIVEKGPALLVVIDGNALQPTSQYDGGLLKDMSDAGWKGDRGLSLAARVGNFARHHGCRVIGTCDEIEAQPVGWLANAFGLELHNGTDPLKAVMVEEVWFSGQRARRLASTMASELAPQLVWAREIPMLPWHQIVRQVASWGFSGPIRATVGIHEDLSKRLIAWDHGMAYDRVFATMALTRANPWQWFDEGVAALDDELYAMSSRVEMKLLEDGTALDVPNGFWGYDVKAGPAGLETCGLGRIGCVVGVGDTPTEAKIAAVARAARVRCAGSISFEHPDVKPVAEEIEWMRLRGLSR